MSPVNPYLWPVRRKSIQLVFRPLRLSSTIAQFRNAPLAIGAALANLGYAYPPEEIIERHTHIRFTQDRVTMTFPPTAPELDEQLMLCDSHWNHQSIIYNTTNAERLDRPGTYFYFDLFTGLWVVFTPQDLPEDTAAPYPSVAARYPIPHEGLTPWPSSPTTSPRD